LNKKNNFRQTDIQSPILFVLFGTIQALECRLSVSFHFSLGFVSNQTKGEIMNLTNVNPTSPQSFHISPPPALAKCKQTHTELQELLSNLSAKVNKVSNQVDKEFLSSYRVHMLSIQTELKNLKHDVTKGEQLLNSDATVAKLEAEAKWFSGFPFVFYFSWCFMFIL
jgi:Skp family chaperone for outer membrane proteins